MIKLSDIKPLTPWDLREQIEKRYQLAEQDYQNGNLKAYQQATPRIAYLLKLLYENSKIEKEAEPE